MAVLLAAFCPQFALLGNVRTGLESVTPWQAETGRPAQRPKADLLNRR
jgi:hypothetical protein